MNNPFTYPFRQQNDSQSSTFRSHTTNQYFTRSVKLTFSWQFGQVRALHDEPIRKIANDDARAK
ncbi:hypothetical protein [Spirosoma telluris]|uniref:hypothetical protein n=1 Tax=Spirosoma telluris TaxID=2183553 RepID=UPI002FC30F7B